MTVILVSLQSIIMICEYFWVVLHDSIDVAAILGHHSIPEDSDVEKA